MKKIIFFDLDGTIHNKKTKTISENTKKLLYKLYNSNNVELGLATGRSPFNIDMIKDIEHIFKYKIFINGALSYKNDKLTYENFINKKQVFKIYDEAMKKDIMLGFISQKEEYILNVKNDIKGLNYNKINKLKIFNKDKLKKENIYQIWMFSNDENKIKNILKNTKIDKYSWHQGGYDIVEKNTNKANSIKRLLKEKTNYQLICIGDGENDIEMINLADIGIAMGNSGFEKLKKSATYVAPSIDENNLYEFFQEIKLIS